ncbi:MAG: hypothetical protein IJH34_00610, partial [Romboutsia sp.]|nr:hypothetical protein [Romboutsia sp.]
FDFKNNLLIEDVGWEIARDENIVNRIKALKEELALLTNLEDKALENNIKSELKDKVKKISYTTSYANGYKYYDYKNNYNYKDKYKDKYKDDNHNFIFDTKSNSYKKFDDDKYNKYTFTKEDDFTVVNYSDGFDDDYHIYDYLKDDTNSGESIFDYFLYDELEEAYQSCNYSYKNMFYWLKENITGLTDEQAHEFLEELDSIKHNNSFEMI